MENYSMGMRDEGNSIIYNIAQLVNTPIEYVDYDHQEHLGEDIKGEFDSGWISTIYSNAVGRVMMENSYISKARCVLAPGSSNQIATNMKNLLLDEAREKKMSLAIKNLIVHSYPCKCVYSASGYVIIKNLK